MASSSSDSSSLLQIKKLEGSHNYDVWQTQCYNVLLQKKQHVPIKTKGMKPALVTDEEWEAMDELAMSTIMLSVTDTLLFSIRDEKSSWKVWQRLQELYAQQSASSKIYWLKKLINLHMKEGTSITTHINEFNCIVSQVINQKLIMDDEFKAAFLLCTLPDSWDTFRTAMSNSSVLLKYADVEGALIQEEMNRKNTSVAKSNALNTRGRSQSRDRNQERRRSTSRRQEM